MEFVCNLVLGIWNFKKAVLKNTKYVNLNLGGKQFIRKFNFIFLILIFNLSLYSAEIEIENNESPAIEIGKRLKNCILTKLKNRCITIADFTDIEGNEITEGKILADELVSVLSKETNIKIVDRKNLDKVLKEQELQMLGLTDLESSKKVASVLNVEGIICGTITELDDFKHINAKLIDANNSLVIESFNVKIKSGGKRKFNIPISEDLNKKLDEEIKNEIEEYKNEPELHLSKIEHRKALLELQERNPEKFREVIKTIKIIERSKIENPKLFLLLPEPENSPKIKRIKKEKSELYEKLKELRRNLKFIVTYSPAYREKLIKEREKIILKNR